jgi:hypothetical protein
MQDNRVSFRADLELRDWLEQRAVHGGRDESTDKRARTELELWRDVLHLELQRTGWTLDELTCLHAILASTTLPAHPSWTGQAYTELDVAQRTDPAAMNDRYGADFLARLSEKLRQLSTAADIALVDAIHRWDDNRDLDRDTAGYTAVGFRVAAPVPAGSRP